MYGIAENKKDIGVPRSIAPVIQGVDTHTSSTYISEYHDASFQRPLKFHSVNRGTFTKQTGIKKKPVEGTPR